MTALQINLCGRNAVKAKVILWFWTLLSACFNFNYDLCTVDVPTWHSNTLKHDNFNFNLVLDFLFYPQNLINIFEPQKFNTFFFLF